MPGFKPNMQKSKTFAQRIGFGSNLQFNIGNILLPGMADIGVSIGYKINDKSVVGIGGSYKLGIGNINRIHFSNLGASLRSYAYWKLKKQFFIIGGFEVNYLSTQQSTYQIKNQWQQNGLLGLSKK